MFITINNGNISAEIIEKKSKFIANIYYVENKEDAENKIKDLKKKYYDARHNCSAYRIITEEGFIEKSSDDGEPSGTAGAPMLNILQKGNWCNILVVVTRYFGGILLGTGGLVRAYSDATQKALELSEKVCMCLGKEFEIKLDYSSFENFKYYCKKNEINIFNVKYDNEIVCNIEIENENIVKFLDDIEKKNVIIFEYQEKQERYIRKKIEEK